ncbi:alpha-1,2-fucosyltransferase [Devosia faecipullorum]|uniref:alpha-1,2-fucosyltransferase n=1 Tax=Devosia faecipullorum TaxID=2755039 RepID=UPI00187B7DE8|nr:alpha-1,2-fucosyltransferase [Devosia faecipullorum]MBE7734527.1 alpha-1,2-fucosyltransferase [Devosia faecipullorum]
MISVQLTGGLGNQMFSYAAALSAATRLRTDLGIIRERNVPDRPYLLDKLQVPQNFVSPAFARGRFSRRISRLLDRRTYREPSFFYDEKFNRIPDGTTIEGYFQSWRYFDGVDSEVRNHFSIKEKLDGMNALLAERIQGTSNAISLHVRRGDYLKPAHAGTHGVLSIEYYRRAVGYIKAFVPNATFFVFSDDMDWAAQNIVPNYPAVAVVGNNNKPWADMALMSLCNHHIIANSSFSWWGAWLNAKQDKKVIAPRQWFSEGAMRRNNTCDLYPADWCLL